MTKTIRISFAEATKLGAEVPAWRWVYVYNADVQVVVHVTGQALPDWEAAQQYVGAGCTVLHRCDETETLTDME